MPVDPGLVLTWRERLSLWGYGLFMRAITPLLRRKLRRRGQAEPGYLVDMEQRFGRYPRLPGRVDEDPSRGGAARPGFVWVHAVSLGETRAAALLLQALRARLPGVPVLLTHGTATGRTEGEKLLQPDDVQVWQPWDTPDAVQRFLAHFRPVMGVLMETEVWPHWVQTTRAAGVPLFLANARLSEKSLRQAQSLPSLSGPAYRGLAGVLAQTEADADRLQRLGAPVEPVEATPTVRATQGRASTHVHATPVSMHDPVSRAFGNLKFDVRPDPVQSALGQRWRSAAGERPVVMLASTREGEEALWLDTLARHPRARAALWLVVPRHPQRFDVVADMLARAGLSVFRRSAGDPSHSPHGLAAGVWLGDSLGEMPAYYAMADMAWLGGSFLPLGGQNLIEAAACACPVIMGPHTFNFADAAEQAERGGAALRVADMDEAMERTLDWIDQPAERASAQAAGLRLWQQGQGAADRYAQRLAQAYLAQRARG